MVKMKYKKMGKKNQILDNEIYKREGRKKCWQLPTIQIGGKFEKRKRKKRRNLDWTKMMSWWLVVVTW